MRAQRRRTVRRALHAACALLWLLAVLAVHEVVLQRVADAQAFAPPASTCASTQFFDTSALDCASCGTGGRQSSTDSTRCVCSDGYRRAYLSAATETCVQCGSNEAATSDRLACLPCDGATGAVFDATNLVCTCPSTSMHLTDRTFNGSLLTALACVNCPSGSRNFPSVDRFTCVSCPDGNMTYTGLGVCACNSGFTQALDTCVPDTIANSLLSQFPLATASAVTFNDVVTATGDTTTSSVTSYLFQTSFLWAAYGCRTLHNRTACNALANMCVLQMYLTSTSACTLFNSIAASITTVTHSVAQWRQSLPWLYYAEGNAAVTATDVTIVPSFDEAAGVTTTLSFKLARFAFNGTFLGLSTLGTDLLLCPAASSYVSEFSRFGSQTTLSCSLNVTALLDMSADSGVMFDLYLVDGSNLYPVPVLVRNYRTTSGTLVNAATATSTSTRQFVRRFFVTDYVAGRTSQSDPPTVVRFAKSITLRTELRTDVSSRIFPPYLIVEYTARTRNGILASTTLASTTVSFSSVYTMDLASFYTVAVSLLGVLLALVFVWWMFRLYQRNRRFHSPSCDVGFCCYGFFKFWMLVSSALFVLLTGLSVYWVIFFKVQNAVFVLLPTLDDTAAYVAVLIVAIVGKAMHMIFLLHRQTTADMFFFDWEKSRARIIQSDPTAPQKAMPVSIWRTLFVANEWSEISSVRAINVPFTLLMTLFFLSGLGLDNVATQQPDITNLASGTRHPFLRFGVIAFFMLALALVQAIWDVAIYRRYIFDPAVELVDLMSIANISCLVLDERYHGYYVHGRSVHSFADTDMEEMIKMLRDEAENTVRRRGLEDGTNVQTFEVFLTKSIREQYDEIFTTVMQQDEEERRLASAGQTTGLLPTKKPVGEGLVKAYRVLNSFLQNFVDRQLKGEHTYVIRERSYVERVFSLAPEENILNRDSVFYRDKSLRGFTNAGLLGNELALLIFDTLVFVGFDLATNNVVIAGFLTFLVQWGVELLRSSLGQRNLSRKTLVDGRFLI